MTRSRDGSDAGTGPSPSATISAVIPTRNEAANLPYLLPTIRWCDEVVVVDQGSTDATRQIAERAGAVVVATEPPEVFDAGRAVGVERARGDWILTLDADEMIPPPLAERLQRLAREPDVDIVAIPRLNYFLGPFRAAGFWPDLQYRFFRRGAVRLAPEIHSNYKLESTRITTLPLADELAIHHFAYRGASRLVGQLNHYTDLELLKEPPRAERPRQLVWRPIAVFLSRYLRHGGFREGVRGLWLSAYWAAYTFVVAVKRWEKTVLPSAQAAEDQARRDLLAQWDQT